MNIKNRKKLVNSLYEKGWRITSKDALGAFTTSNADVNEDLEEFIHELAHNALISFKELNNPKDTHDTADLIEREPSAEKRNLDEIKATAVTVLVLEKIGIRFKKFVLECYDNCFKNLEVNFLDKRPTRPSIYNLIDAKKNQVGVQRVANRIYDYCISLV